MTQVPDEPDPQRPASQRPEGDTADSAPRLAQLQTENQALKAQIDELKSLSTQGDAEPRRSLQNLHLLQIQPVRDLLVILLVVGVIYLGYMLRPLTVPLLLALTLAYLFEPVVRRMTAHGRVGRPFAAISLIFAMVLLVTMPVAFGVTYGTLQGVHYGQQLTRNIGVLQASVADPDDKQLAAEVVELGETWTRLRDFLVGVDRGALRDPETEDGEEEASAEEEARAPPDEEEEEEEETVLAADVEREMHGLHENGTIAGETLQLGQPRPTPAYARAYARQILTWVNEWIQRSAASLGEAFGRQALGTGSDVLRIVWRVVSRSAYLAFAAFLVLFFFFFFSVNYQRVLHSFSELIPSWKRARTIEMIRKMDGVVSGFVRGRMIIMCIQTVMFIIGYWTVGVPAPLVVGLIIGVLSLVPYLSLVGIPLTITLMWLQPDPPVWWWVVFAPTVVYFIVQLSDDYVWTPLIQGKATDMDIPSILFAVLAGGILAGFYGVLLAIPATACIKILLKEAFWPRFKAWSEGRVKDFLPISRYDPTAAEVERTDRD